MTGLEFDGTTEARPGERRTWVASYYPMRLERASGWSAP